MNRLLVLILGLAIIAGGAASAQSFYSQSFENPRVVAGRVSSTGEVIAGKGFSVRREFAGRYHIVFNSGIFPQGCPTVTVTDIGSVSVPPIPEIDSPRCGRAVLVIFHSTQQYVTQDTDFGFVAVAQQYRSLTL